MQPVPETTWTAYNDSVYQDPQFIAPNVTTVAIGRGNVYSQTTNLLNFATGEDTAVTATYTEFLTQGSVSWSPGNIASYVAGSEAAALFDGKVDLTGNISYGDAPGWYVDLTFTGLDPSRQYSFFATADRAGGSGYADRVTNWKILGASTYAYAGSPGARKVGDDSAEFSTGSNIAGDVAGWTNIVTGPNGAFVIRSSHTVGVANGGIPGAHSYKGYGGGIFLLSQQAGSSDGGIVSKPLEFFNVEPAAEAQEAFPNTPVFVVIKNGDFTVATNSIQMSIDNKLVTPTVTQTTNSTIITYEFSGLLTSLSSHTVKLAFTDSSSKATPYAKEWSFKVMDYSAFPTLDPNYALSLDSLDHKQRGVAIRVAAPDASSGIFIASVDEAVDVWNWDFVNLADPAITNQFGYYIEKDVINYQIDRNPKGNRASETLFPGIVSGTTPGVPFALNGKALLHLLPGYYHMEITMQGGFRLTVGNETNQTEVFFQFSPCTNCGGDDAPWLTDFLVSKEGFYPFNLVYYNGGNNGSLEWVTVAPDGSRFLVNESVLEAVPAYAPVETFAVPAPHLTVRFNQGNVVISWPDRFTGFSLEATETLNAGFGWAPVAATTTNAAGVNTATVPVSGAARFFRLKQ
jgi:hypothetical protein